MQRYDPMSHTSKPNVRFQYKTLRQIRKKGDKPRASARNLSHLRAKTETLLPFF